MYPSLCRLLRIGWALSFVYITAACPDQVIAEDWKEHLLSEAPPKWAALKQYYSQMEASFRVITSEVPSPEMPLYTHYFDVKQNGESIVSKRRIVGKSPDGKPIDLNIVEGVNSHYSFKLRKPMPNADNYVLGDLQKVDGENRPRVSVAGDASFSLVYEVCISNCVPLMRLFEDPDIRITGVQGVRRGPKEMIQLKYDCKMPTSEHPDGIVHGIVILDPEHYWCILEDHNDSPGFNQDNYLEYGDIVDGFPILRRIQGTTTYKDRSGRRVNTWEFDSLVHREIAENEFTLSAFGLPELQLPGEQKPRTLWYWLLGIGIALGVIAVLVRRHAKKRQVQQNA